MEGALGPEKRGVGGMGLAGGWRSGAELVAQQFVGLHWIGLAAAGLHDLSDQRMEGLFLALAELFDALRVGGDDLDDHPLEFAGVAQLAQPHGLDQGVDVQALTVP